MSEKQPVFHVKRFCRIKWVRTGINDKYQLYQLHQTIHRQTGIKWVSYEPVAKHSESHTPKKHLEFKKSKAWYEAFPQMQYFVQTATFQSVRQKV